MNPFPHELHFDNAGMRNGRRCIILTKPFSAITSLGVIKVPAGFVSDGASIPKPAWGIIGSPFDEFLEEAVIHDMLYSPLNHDYSREEADYILKELMWNCGVSKWKIAAFHIALRLFGGPNFKAKIGVL